jgi:hypothetical protein
MVIVKNIMNEAMIYKPTGKFGDALSHCAWCPA